MPPSRLLGIVDEAARRFPGANAIASDGARSRNATAALP